MKRTLCSLAAGLATGLIVANTQGASVVVVDDNFDSYVSQAAFEAVWLPITPTSAILSVAEAASTPNSVFVPGTLTNTQNRNRRDFAETGPVDPDHQIVWSFDFFDSNAGVSPYRNFSNLQDSVPNAPSLANQLVAMGLNNNQTSGNSGGNYYMARILGYSPTAIDPDGGANESITGSGAFFKLNDFGVGTRSTGWHNLKVVISTGDGLNTDYAFYVDNQLAERVSNVGAVGSNRGYDNITLGSGLSNANNTAFFDNVFLEHIDLRAPVVPLPAAAPAGLALMGLTALKRRR